MLGLKPNWRAVLAVAGDVEYRSARTLQFERLGNEPLAAGVMDARRKRRQRTLVAV